MSWTIQPLDHFRHRGRVRLSGGQQRMRRWSRISAVAARCTQGIRRSLLFEAYDLAANTGRPPHQRLGEKPGSARAPTCSSRASWWRAPGAKRVDPSRGAHLSCLWRQRSSGRPQARKLTTSGTSKCRRITTGPPTLAARLQPGGVCARCRQQGRGARLRSHREPSPWLSRSRRRHGEALVEVYEVPRFAAID